MSPRAMRQGGLPAAIAAAFAVFAVAIAGLAQVAAAEPVARTSKVTTVEVVSFAFKPATVHVQKGSSVAFANRSKVIHTATDEGVFDTGTIKPGKTAVVQLSRKGTFRFHCLIHQSMRGKIVVE